MSKVYLREPGAQEADGLAPCRGTAGACGRGVVVVDVVEVEVPHDRCLS